MLGTQGVLKWRLFRSAVFQGQFNVSIMSIWPTVLQHPVNVRLQGSSDADVFRQICMERELEFSRFMKAPFDLIFDLGANVGYASAWFLTLYPQAELIAVEPDPGNAEMCRANLSSYGSRVKVIEGAVWHTRDSLVLSRGTFGDGREWATQVRIANPGEKADVEAWDISSLLEKCVHKRVDLLKIDIEGSEISLFSCGSADWLHRVRNICIELHGTASEKAFFSALKDFDFECSRSGEYTLCLNIRRKNHLASESTPAAF